MRWSFIVRNPQSQALLVSETSKYPKKTFFLSPAIHGPSHIYKFHARFLDKSKLSFTLGFTCLQAGDTDSFRNRTFTLKNSGTMPRYDWNLRAVPEDRTGLTFSETKISFSSGSYSNSQPDQVRKLQNIPENNDDKSEFAARRARCMQYSSLQLAAQSCIAELEYSAAKQW